MKQWWAISGPRWTFAIVEEGGVVVQAAPISKWAVGKPLKTVISWWRSKGADEVIKL